MAKELKGRIKANGEGSMRQRKDTGQWEARLMIEGKSKSFYGRTNDRDS